MSTASKVIFFILLFLISAIDIHAAPPEPKTIKTLTDYSRELGSAAIFLETAFGNEQQQIAVGIANKQKKIKAHVQAPFPIGSTTKVFVGVALFQLIESGKLSLDTTLNTFYPEEQIRQLANYQGKNYFDEVTVGMLMQHTSGFIDYLNIYKDPAKALDIYTKNGDHYRFENIIGLAEKFGDAHFKPGAKFSYCNTGYIILGDIIQKVSGEDWRDYVQTHILDILGMKHTYFGTRLSQELQAQIPQGYFAGKPVSMPFSLASSAGEMVSTVDDLRIFIDAWGSSKLYKDPKTLKQQMTKGFHLMSSIVSNISYGYSIMKIGNSFGHGGQTFGFQSFMATDLDNNKSYALGINEAKSDAMALYMNIAGIHYAFDVPSSKKKHAD